jgi:hypothetical protein
MIEIAIFLSGKLRRPDKTRTWLEAASGQDCGPPAQTPTLWPLNLKH